MNSSNGFRPTTLGRTGLRVSRIGLASGYGISGADVERAFERGVNYLYWSTPRRPGFGAAVRALARRHRQDMVVVVQSSARVGAMIGPSVERGLRRLGIEYADVLLLGWWNKVPPPRILDSALALREAGKVRHLMVSCHHRPTFAALIADPCFGAIMVRYNAAHRGAESEVFPLVEAHAEPPGVVAYTATRWGKLLDPRRVPQGQAVPRASDCYRFVLGHPQVDMCLSGPRNSAELSGALDALERGPMDADELAWMRQVGDAVHGARLAPSPARLWARITGIARARRTRS
jgi:aryl-alcohol dehydrogenase-like predicted oxidoreductase